MKKLHPILVIILNVFTFGLFGLVWLYLSRKAMVAKGLKIPSVLLLAIPAAIIVVSWLSLLMSYFAKVASQPNDAALQNTGVQLNSAFMVIVILMLLVLVPISLVWFYKFSKAAEQYTGGRLTFGLAYGSWLALTIFGFGLFWIGLIQYYFIQAADVAPSTPYQPAPQQPGPPQQQMPPQAPPAA